MQKKQVKILGYQSNSCKLKLYFETNGKKSRYIVEKNRKYQITTENYELAKKRMQSLIYIDINQLTLNI